MQNNLGEECDQGILLNKDIAYVYMSILAEIISKETGTDMITDNMQYTDPTLRYVMRYNKRNVERLNKIRNEIQFYVPVDLRDLIECRKDIYGLITKLFFGCAAVMVVASSLVKLPQSADDALSFWNNAGGMAVSVDTLRSCAYEAKEFAKKLEGKRQARKYLAKLRELRPNILQDDCLNQ